MNTVKRVGALGAFLFFLGVSGCVIAPAHGPDQGYRYENGDRIDRSGHREVHWCDAHRDDDEHCRS